MKGLKTFFLLSALCFIALSSEAKADKPAKSALNGIFYRIGGGMNPYDDSYAYLRKEKDGRLLLTLLGECPGETLTFEVGDSVLTHCQQLIVNTKLYKAKGDYKAPGDFIVLDAPTRTFEARYEDWEENVYASGWIPSKIGNAINEVYDYLTSLRGDRQSPGHLRFRQGMSQVPDGSYTNGEIVYTPDDSGIEELYKFLAGKYGMDYERENWHFQLAEGSGFKAVIISSGNYMEVFNDVETANHSIQTDREWKTCPEVSQRLLTRKDIAHFDDDELSAIPKEIYYELGGLEQPSDLERQNISLIYSMRLWRNTHPKE